MVAGVFSYASNLVRRLRSNGGTLEDDLKRITDSGVIDVPQELCNIIIEESREELSRKMIMNHLRQCLTDISKPKDWKRAYVAMVLAEELLQKGSSALLAETAVGRHFDLVQRLSFLEQFELSSNELATNMIRSKAKSLRANVTLKLRAFGGKFQKTSKPDYTDEDLASTCSPKGSVCTSLYSDTTVSQMPTYDFEDLVSWADGEQEDADAWYRRTPSPLGTRN